MAEVLRECEQPVSGKEAEFPARPPACYPCAIQNERPGRLLLTALTPRFAVKNSFLLPISQSLGIAVAAKWRFLEVVPSCSSKRGEGAHVFSAVPAFMSVPLRTRGRGLWGCPELPGLMTGSAGGAATSRGEICSTPRAPGSPLGSPSGAERFCSGLRLSLCSSSRSAEGPFRPLSTVVHRVWAIPGCLHPTRPSQGAVGDPPRGLCLHLSLPTAPWTRSIFSAETLALAGRYEFLCLENQVQAPFIFFLEKN